LEFLTGDCKRAKRPVSSDQMKQPNQAGPSGLSSQIPKQRIQDHLQRLMKENTSFDEICAWITVSTNFRWTNAWAQCVCVCVCVCERARARERAYLRVRLFMYV